MLVTGLGTSAGHCRSEEGASQAHVDRVEIGHKVARLTFYDIRYLHRSLDELASPRDPVETKGYLLLFTTTNCPLVQKYLPVLKELDAEFEKRGVKFLAINALIRLASRRSRR